MPNTVPRVASGNPNSLMLVDPVVRLTPFRSVRMNSMSTGSYKGFNGLEGSINDSFNGRLMPAGLGFLANMTGYDTGCNWLDDFGQCIGPNPGSIITTPSGVKAVVTGSGGGAIGYQLTPNAGGFDINAFISKYGMWLLVGGVAGLVLSRR